MKRKISPDARNYVMGDIIGCSVEGKRKLYEIIRGYYTVHKEPVHIFYIKDLDTNEVIKIRARLVYNNSELINRVTGTKREILRREKRRQYKSAIREWYRQKERQRQRQRQRGVK